MQFRSAGIFFVIFFGVIYCMFAQPKVSAKIQDIPITTSNQHAAELLKQAQRLIDVGRPLEAQPLLEQAVHLDPSFSYAYLLLANVSYSGFSFGYSLLSNTGVSPKQFKENLDAAKKNAEGKTERERLLIEINQTFIDNNTTKRIDLAKSLVEKYPQSPRAWLTLGFMQGTTNQLTESRQSMSKALDLDPEFVGAHYGIAFSYLFNEPRDFKQAEKHFQQCIKLEPAEAKGYEGLGDTYRAMNQLQPAGEAYDKAIQIDSKLTTARVKKGHVNSFLGMFDEARADYDQAILEEPEPVNKVSYENLRALVHVHAGDSKAAIDEQRKVAESANMRGLSADQSDALKQTILTNQITIALHSNLLKVAENVLEELKTVNGKINQRNNDLSFSRQTNAAFVLLEGQLAAKKKDFEMALVKAAENRKLMESDQSPRKLEGYYSLLGSIALQEGKYAEAVTNYEKADQTNIYVKYNLGLACEGSGQTAKAKKLFKDIAHFNFNTIEFALVRKDALQRSVEQKKDLSFNEAEAIENLKKAIAGKEKEPAEKVFENIQVLKGIPAERLLGVMKIAYAKSLGVDCTFCHNPIHWELDEKPNKLIAREMILMMRNLNQNVLPKIKGLENKEPRVNCTTCHRGQIEPALDIE